MDGDAARKKRLEEIEAKRKRLEQMRKSRGATAASGSSSSSSFSSSSSSSSPLRTSSVASAIAAAEANAKMFGASKEETDDLVNSLLKSKPPGSDLKKADGEGQGSEPQSKVSREHELLDKIASFQLVEGKKISIKPAVKYSKSIQTEDENDPDESDEEADKVPDSPAAPQPGSLAGLLGRVKAMGAAAKQAPGSPGKDASSGPGTGDKDKTASDKPKALSEVECKRIQADKVFLQFLKKSSLYVERALDLSDQHDLLRDYSVDNSLSASDKKNAFSEGSAFEDDTVKGRPIMDLKWSPLVPELFLAAYGTKVSHGSASGSAAAGSSSGHHVGGPNSSTDDDEPPGMVCIWSRDLHRRPEFKFTASSPVLSGIFHPHEQHLVIGGCYSGQILLWDMRSGKNLPLQRSSMAGGGHKHPVYAMAMTSSTVSSELVSVSMDGMVCHWDITNLVEPMSVTMLAIPNSPSGVMAPPVLAGLNIPFADATPVGSAPLSLCAMTFGNSSESSEEAAAAAAAATGTSASIVGLSGTAIGGGAVEGGAGATAAASAAAHDILFATGAGELIRTPLPYKPGGGGIIKVDAHLGLITAVQPHPNPSNKYKNLVLSSSLDWSVKLWNLSSFAHPVFEFTSASYDYVCDVQWSPVHPAVFVTITSGGSLALWNLSKSTTEPVDVTTLIKEEDLNHHKSGAASNSGGGAGGGGSSSGSGGAGNVGAGLHHGAALNKVAWAQDGQAVLVGDSYGKLHWMKLQPAHAQQATAADETRFEMAMVAHQLSAVSPAWSGTGGAETMSGESKFGITDSGGIGTGLGIGIGSGSGDGILEPSAGGFDAMRGGRLLSRMGNIGGGGQGGRVSTALSGLGEIDLSGED